MGGRKAVELLLERVSESPREPVDILKELADHVVNHVTSAINKSGMIETGVFMATHFHVVEYMGVAVKISRLYRPHGITLWAEIRVLFKGYDGNMVNSKHVVTRFVEFYSPDKIDRNELYKAVYGAIRVAYNLYGGVHDGR
jgi:hypothetical protein